jgi:hypothetical protein
MPAPPLVNSDTPSALSKGQIEMRVPHRVGIAQELEQGRHICQTRRTEYQTRGFNCCRFFRHCERSEAISIGTRLLRRVAPRNEGA